MTSSPLDAYYAALDAGDDDAAAAAFAEDAVYIRPAVSEGGRTRGVEVIRGRPGIRELFERRRERQKLGEYSHFHELRAAALERSRCFVEGLMMTDKGPVGVFLAHATLDDEGLITRYIAVFTETPGGFEALPA